MRGERRELRRRVGAQPGPRPTARGGARGRAAAGPHQASGGAAGLRAAVCGTRRGRREGPGLQAGPPTPAAPRLPRDTRTVQGGGRRGGRRRGRLGQPLQGPALAPAVLGLAEDHLGAKGVLLQRLHPAKERQVGLGETPGAGGRGARGRRAGARASPGCPPQRPLLRLQSAALRRGQGSLRHRQLGALHAQPLLMAPLGFSGPHGRAVSHGR